MLEKLNRILTAHFLYLIFAPKDKAVINIKNEG